MTQLKQVQMKRGLKTIIAAVALLITGQAIGQQLPVTGLYYQNKFLVNPAAAGEQDVLAAFLNHRRQWVGIEGAPVTNILSVHSPIGNGNQAVGATLSTDRTHILQRTSGTIAYSQRFNFSKQKKHFLAIGAGIGFIDNRINLSGVNAQDPTEIILGANQINGTTFNIDAGLEYRLSGFTLGVSVPQVLETSVNYNEFGGDRFMELKRHLVAYTGYNFRIKDGIWMIEPSALFRYLPNGNYQIDGNLYINWKDIVWVGGTYRTDAGIIPAVGFRVAKQFSVTYAYELSNSSLAKESNGTHEVMVGFRLGGARDRSLEEEIEKLKKNQDTLWTTTKDLREDVDSLETRMDANEAGDETQGNDIDENERRIEELENQMKELKNAMPNDLDTNQIKDMLMRLIKRVGSDGSVSYDEAPLEKGNYVVIESFRTIERAERAVELWKEKEVDAIIVHNKKRKWYYVYSKRYDTLKPALEEMRKVRASGLQEKAWVHIYKGE